MILTKRYKIIGNVQHVGYRAHVKKAADTAKLMGTVNHGEAGTILVIAQGEETVFTEFEKALRFGSIIYFVREVQSATIDKSPYYRSFQIEGNVLSTKLTTTLEKIQQQISEEQNLINGN